MFTADKHSSLVCKIINDEAKNFNHYSASLTNELEYYITLGREGLSA